MRSRIAVSILFALTVGSTRLCVSQEVEPGNRIDVEVHSRCSGQLTNVIVYSYDVRSQSGSIQPIWVFDPLVRIPADSITSASLVPGWFTPHRFPSEKSADECNVSWHFDSDTSSGGIPPGGRENRFSFSARYLPGIGNYYAEGYHLPPSFPEGMAEDSVPGYDDLTPYGPGIVGRTVVPVLLGSAVSCSTLLDSLDSYVVQSRALNWITSQNVAAKYSGFVSRTRSTLLPTRDPRAASRILDSLMGAIPPDSIQGAITTDVSALLRFNTACLISKLLPSMQVK